LEDQLVAATKYTYSISADTANGILGSGLQDEIHASAIVVALDRVESSGDVLDIWMKGSLSAGDETILNGVVGAHAGALTSDEPHDSDNAPIVRLRAFSNTDGIFFRGSGMSGTATKTTTTNFDYNMPEDRYLNGIEIFLKNQEWGDTMKLQVVDVDGAVYPAGTVLDEFGTDWHCASDEERQGPYILPYPALVNSVFYIRVAYTSVGTVNDVDFKANLFLHKKP
jgi:hypothetical protein